MGAIRLTSRGPFIAGSLEELTLVYTAGTFGIDDTGMLKISWRTTSDMAKPESDKPQAPNFTTVEASNGATLEVRDDRLNIRPYAHTLLIRVGRGYLRQGDPSPSASATGERDRPAGGCDQRREERRAEDINRRLRHHEFCELPAPSFDLVSGPAATGKRSCRRSQPQGEPFRLALVAEDMWGIRATRRTSPFPQIVRANPRLA